MSSTRPVFQLLSSTVSTGEAATIVAAHRPLGRLDYGIQTYVQRRSSGRLRQFDSMGCRGWCSEDGPRGRDVDRPGLPEPLGHDRGEPRRRREQGPTWRRRRGKRRRQKQGRGSRRRPLTSESLMLLAANTPSDTLGKRVAEGAIPQSLHRFQSRRRRAARSSTRLLRDVDLPSASMRIGASRPATRAVERASELAGPHSAGSTPEPARGARRTARSTAESEVMFSRVSAWESGGCGG
jgi:hypothetical protein